MRNNLPNITPLILYCFCLWAGCSGLFRQRVIELFVVVCKKKKFQRMFKTGTTVFFIKVKNSTSKSKNF